MKISWLYYLIAVLVFLLLVFAINTCCIYTTAHEARVVDCVRAGKSPAECREGLL